MHSECERPTSVATLPGVPDFSVSGLFFWASTSASCRPFSLAAWLLYLTASRASTHSASQLWVDTCLQMTRYRPVSPPSMPLMCSVPWYCNASILASASSI
jgi:hypothetical protein